MEKISSLFGVHCPVTNEIELSRLCKVERVSFWFSFQQNYDKCTVLICTELGGEMGCGQGKNLLKSGADTDHFPCI